MKPLRPHVVHSLGHRFYFMEKKLHDRQLSIKEIFFTREPFSRFVGSFRDKIERLDGRQYYYETVTLPILQQKYPSADLPKYGWDWDFGKTSNLTMTFQNFIEYIVGDHLTGYDAQFKPDCIQVINNCSNSDQLVLSKNKDFTGKRRSYVFDIHFDRQVAVCGVCRYKDCFNLRLS